MLESFIRSDRGYRRRKAKAGRRELADRSESIAK
jgi:hypothetical protein